MCTGRLDLAVSMLAHSRIDYFWLVLQLTFETLSSRLFEKVLLAAVVRNVTTVRVYVFEWTDVVLEHVSHRSIVQVLKGWEVDDTLGLALGVAGVSFDHLLLPVCWRVSASWEERRSLCVRGQTW